MNTTRAIALSAALWFATEASAQMIDGMQLASSLPGEVSIAVGALAISEPRFPGNGRHQFAFPLFDAQWRRGLFISTLSGIGYRIEATPSLQLGFRATADFGRKAANTYGRIAARPELGPFANWTIAPTLILNTALRYGAGNARRGLLLDSELEYQAIARSRYRLVAGYALSYANRNLLQEYYGAPAFSIGAGLKDERFKLRHTYRFDRSWGSYMEIRSTRPLGAVRDSPLLQHRRQASLIGGISYAW